MLKSRLIFTLLMKNGSYQLSRNFNLQDVGDLNWIKKYYNFNAIAFSIDELIVVNVERTEKNVTIEAELPGIDRKDVKVEVKDNLLTISGERKREKKTENTENCCVERYYGKFERSFNLGDTVNADKVTAEYKNGVLTLNLPKKEAALPKEISIEVK